LKRLAKATLRQPAGTRLPDNLKQPLTGQEVKLFNKPLWQMDL